MIPAMQTWKILAASRTGVSHESSGSPCQDACASWADRDLLVAVACDGAGSAERSGEGARLAADTFTRTVRRLWTEGIMDTAMLLSAAASESRAALLALAEAEGLAPRVFATTLVGIIAGPAGAGSVHQGDGMAAVRDLQGSWQMLSAPERGEYANETRFLTDDDAPERWRISEWKAGLSAVAVLTDGLEPVALDQSTGGPFAPFFEPLHAYACRVSDPSAGSAQLHALLGSARFQERCDDDLTLLLAVLKAPANP